MSLFGSVFGDAKDTDTSTAPNELARISRDLFNQGGGLREALFKQYEGFLGSSGGVSSNLKPPEEFFGGIENPRTRNPNYESELAAFNSATASAPGATSPFFDVSRFPQYAALKNATEAQYGRARDATIGTTPSGGALSSALANLEGQRANTLVQGTGDIANQEMARAFALATGTTPVALSGLGSAAGSLSNLGAAQAQQQASALQGIGAGVGSQIAGKGGKTASEAAAVAV